MGDVPALGEHTAAVLAEFGYSAEEVDELVRSAAPPAALDVPRVINAR